MSGTASSDGLAGKAMAQQLTAEASARFAGKRLLHYTIHEKIGSGGMGVVYRARDERLARDVAIKSLPGIVANDPEHLARLEREAKLLASVNHPNIAAIHGLEESNGRRFLVLELVEGETLAARLIKGALPLNDTLEICRQIAEGLEAAHQKGVIHRDLKPANVKITPEGTVKILDFGLAKPMVDTSCPAGLTGLSMITEAITTPGIILGTSAYMSPEAWVPSGKEIWFSGADVSINTSLKSVDLSGHERVVTRGPGRIIIQDIAGDGRALLGHENARIATMAFGPGQNQERDLTVVNRSVVYAISPDGRKALLVEGTTGSNDIYLRSTDGSAPVRLGEGLGYDFSADMKWVLASRGQLFLIPLGPGEAQQITRDSITHAEARFLPGWKGVVFTGTEPGHKPRIYTQTFGADSPHAISPEGVRGMIPTPDGRFVFGFSDVVALYPVHGNGAPRTLSGIRPDDFIAAVSPDGRTVLVVSSATHFSLDVFRVDLASGRRELVKQIVVPDPAGASMNQTGSVTPDGKYYAYSFGRTLGELYIVTGLE
jgi:hypothetical protein